MAVAFTVLLPGAAPADTKAVELTVSPRHPSLFSPAQIRLRVKPSVSGQTPSGTVSFEIRPTDPKLRSLGSERIDSADWITPDTAQTIHNWRIAGAYEVVATLASPDGSSSTATVPVTVVEGGQLGFWSETWLKSLLFVVLSLIVLLFSQRTSGKPSSWHSQTPGNPS